MAEIDPEQSIPSTGNDITEPGRVYLEEDADQQPSEEQALAQSSADAKVEIRPTAQALERAGAVEHLAARRAVTAPNVNTPEIKQRLSALRAEFTRNLTSLRWENQSIEETARNLVPLLNIGPVQQWKTVLIPFLYEIDRGGVLIPTWLSIIDQGDRADLPPESNPADSTQGRARRFAILMLGNYRMIGISGTGKTARFASRGESDSKNPSDIAGILGRLATDPTTSLYATEALARHDTIPAKQALMNALKDAKGWAKIDVVEACLTLNQEQFYDLILASGLADVTGLESYIAIPIYRTIPLESYLRNESGTNTRLSTNAALIVAQVLQDSMTPPKNLTASDALPAIFARYLPPVAQSLFAGARSNPGWQYAVAVHRLGVLLGRYWSEISSGKLQDGRIIDPVYQCLPMMNDVERWMSGPGRDTLLEALDNTAEDVPGPVVRVVGELRDPRAVLPIVRRIETISTLHDRAQALTIGALCDTLGQLGDRRTATSMFQLVNRTVNIERRTNMPKRRDNLQSGDADIPGSIVYAAVVRAAGNLGETSVLDGVLQATKDFDPYVRTQALESLKHLDPNGADVRSRSAAREELGDPRDSVIRVACQLIVQYHDRDAIPALQSLMEARPDLSYLAQDALHQLRQ
ncbi:MAG: hypothetical protein H0U76_12050 [Ktedonobacteraceae bacterium]|nr:hypothetical protein [Ktedonobacteraceae bacterium]